MVKVVVVGAGIGGLTAALSLHEVGCEVRVLEAAHEMRALGVGINLQPHAVRELEEMALTQPLLELAITPHALVYFSKHGKQIWAEDRGLKAGYRWPQVSIHRGRLQQLLLATVQERLGPASVATGQRAVHVDGSRVVTEVGDFFEADVIVGADGIRSCVRRQLYPLEGPPRWNGSLLWRGTCVSQPLLDGRTMVWAGHPEQKLVAYPIQDLPDGRQLINVIAELRRPDPAAAGEQDWNRRGEIDEVAPYFADWTFDWLDVPRLIANVEEIYVYPMVDRDPLPCWTAGRVTLLGDAAHPMYPIGSNGASQAILDARVLAGCLRSYADPEAALHAYESVRRPATSSVVLANRELGPEKPMAIVEQRAPMGFDRLNDVISEEELSQLAEEYKVLAGFSVGELNNRPSLVNVHW